MDFKNGVKNIQATVYNGTRTFYGTFRDTLPHKPVPGREPFLKRSILEQL